MTAASATISLAIPVFNGARYLERTLEAVMAQSITPSEVQIIDDGSTDDSVDIASRFPVRILRHGRNQGLASARNTALAHTETTCLAFVDADAAPCRRFLELALREFRDDRVVAVGGRGVEEPGSSLADRWRSAFWQQTLGPSRIQDAWLAIGMCCVFRTAVLSDLGGFDKRYLRAGEDVDISLRLARAGGRIVYQPKIWAMHHRRDSLGSLATMVANHSHNQVLAIKRNRASARRQHLAAARWLAVSTASSLRRHRSPPLAAMSIPLNVLSISAQLAGRLKVLQ